MNFTYLLLVLSFSLGTNLNAQFTLRLLHNNDGESKLVPQDVDGKLIGGAAEFKTLLDAGEDRFPTSKSSVLGDAGRTKFGAPSTGGVFSDATLSILTSKNNAVVDVRFRDVFPISLSGLQYTQQATDTDYLTASVTFDYKLYDFANTNAGRTSITTS